MSSPQLTPRVDLDGPDPTAGLAQLVLTVIELLRDLMERQAVARAELGDLSDEQLEELGSTLRALDLRMDDLVARFGLRRDDLDLDLGPLGRLL